METQPLTPVERWAARSKTHAFTYLVGVALVISACFAGGAGLVVTMGKHDLSASTATPR